MNEAINHAIFNTQIAPEIADNTICQTQIVIVGAGPIGLAAAIDLAMRDIKVVLVDKDTGVADGSRAICWAKRTLEIFDRLGVGETMVAKGVTWQVGRTYWGDDEIYQFDLLPEKGHKNPAFVNLQQYYVEDYLVQRCQDFPQHIDLRFGTTIDAVAQNGKKVTANVSSEYGDYQIEADYLLACDGAHSKTRHLLNLDFKGQHFTEKFLIADVKMDAPFPSERWFWFEPSFHAGQSALLHKQPDNIYRIDFQLPPDADDAFETQAENVKKRIQTMLPKRAFELEWVSIYQFHCRRIEKFIHQRIIFAGDSAHIVSPFGARGGNGGIQDVDNLCWKLELILQEKAKTTLLLSYDEERIHGADENIKNSARTTKFMSPNSDIDMLFRNSLLQLAGTMPFARKLINAGRLSVPCSLNGKSLQTPSPENTHLQSGMVCPDAPMRDKNGKSCWLLNCLSAQFTLLITDSKAVLSDEWRDKLDESITVLHLADDDANDDNSENFIEARYGKACYLIRPDQHITAIWQTIPKHDSITAALHKIIGNR